MNEYVKSDLYRYTGNTSLFSFIKEYLRNQAFRHMVAHRLVNSKGLQFFLGGYCGHSEIDATYKFLKKLK